MRLKRRSQQRYKSLSSTDQGKQGLLQRMQVQLLLGNCSVNIYESSM